jgi:serine/threonine protein kinase
MHFLRKTFTRFFPPSVLVAGTQVHEWKILESLGEGRHGTFYRVERAGRVSVLKWLASQSEQREVLAQWEWTCLRNVSPPHFARLEAYGVWPDKARGLPFLVLEHVPGMSLAQWCRHPGPTARDIIHLFSRLMRGVAELNDRGLCYPSLTCDDVRVREGSYRPVIVDLGGVVSYGRPLTQLELSLDVRAVGAMLYEVLTHQRPGPHSRPPHVVNPQVPLELSELAMRLL